MKFERILTAIIAVCGFALLIYACNFEAPISYDPVGPKSFSDFIDRVDYDQCSLFNISPRHYVWTC